MMSPRYRRLVGSNDDGAGRTEQQLHHRRTPAFIVSLSPNRRPIDHAISDAEGLGNNHHHNNNDRIVAGINSSRDDYDDDGDPLHRPPPCRSRGSSDPKGGRGFGNLPRGDGGGCGGGGGTISCCSIDDDTAMPASVRNAADVFGSSLMDLDVWDMADSQHTRDRTGGRDNHSATSDLIRVTKGDGAFSVEGGGGVAKSKDGKHRHRVHPSMLPPLSRPNGVTQGTPMMGSISTAPAFYDSFGFPVDPFAPPPADEGNMRTENGGEAASRGPPLSPTMSDARRAGLMRDIRRAGPPPERQRRSRSRGSSSGGGDGSKSTKGADARRGRGTTNVITTEVGGIHTQREQKQNSRSRSQPGAASSSSREDRKPFSFMEEHASPDFRFKPSGPTPADKSRKMTIDGLVSGVKHKHEGRQSRERALQVTGSTSSVGTHSVEPSMEGARRRSSPSKNSRNRTSPGRRPSSASPLRMVPKMTTVELRAAPSLPTPDSLKRELARRRRKSLPPDLPPSLASEKADMGGESQNGHKSTGEISVRPSRQQIPRASSPSKRSDQRMRVSSVSSSDLSDAEVARHQTPRASSPSKRSDQRMRVSSVSSSDLSDAEVARHQTPRASSPSKRSDHCMRVSSVSSSDLSDAEKVARHRIGRSPSISRPVLTDGDRNLLEPPFASPRSTLLLCFTDPLTESPATPSSFNLKGSYLSKRVKERALGKCASKDRRSNVKDSLEQFLATGSASNPTLSQSVANARRSGVSNRSVASSPGGSQRPQVRSSQTSFTAGDVNCSSSGGKNRDDGIAKRSPLERPSAITHGRSERQLQIHRRPGSLLGKKLEAANNGSNGNAGDSDDGEHRSVASAPPLMRSEDIVKELAQSCRRLDLIF